MILLHISCNSHEQANSIVDFLIDEKLMIDALVSDSMLFKQLNLGKKESLHQVLIMGTTKALLFKLITQKIKAKYPDNMPLIYATPIVYMEEEQTKHLQDELKKV
ncbi:hypothetical protein MTsPCn9_18600 [Croceitalea sp. MTPC9]|uniref:divalent cation tolerance protein CutA n=1 Tax=unclassified Croceitalea TaxID=2632280 RepID=UPI002B36CF19|nr:hypothetical protein MTsPCn6_11450 [Croceitalea sp. MTPC6]GMN16924.1 hypothetical protein MTsPCn9_18600 [Croceitalea sp. MTPC9]